MLKILVVCIGNVCRSPLVERLLRQRLDDAGLGSSYEVSSAGTYGLTGRPMEPDAAEQLQALGVDPEGHVARRLIPQMVNDADLVLVATTDLRGLALREAPAAMRRTFTVLEFAALVRDLPPAGSFADLVADAVRRRGTLAGAELNIPDPMGRPIEVHAEAARLAAEAVDGIVAALAHLPRVEA